MNLKGFKKVHDDDDKAVLKNERGHEVVIAKRSLTSKHRKDLASLPLYSYGGNNIEKTLDQQKEVKNQMPVEDDSVPEQDSVSQTVAPEQQEQPTITQQQLNQQAPIQAEPQQANPVQQPAIQAEPTQKNQQQEELQPPTPGDSLVSEMRKVGTDLMTNQIKSKNYQDVLFKDSSGNDKPFIGKIGALFGLLLSGAGSGLSHQPNAAMEMMNNEIKNDLESQKQNQSNKLQYYGLINNAIQNQSLVSKNEADIAHLAIQDAPTLDALHMAHARRDVLDKLYRDQVLRYPEGSPQRQKAEATFGMMTNAANAADQSAAALVNGRWGLYKNQPGMIGGPNSVENSTGTQGNNPSMDGIDYQKWNQLKGASAQKLPNAPTEPDLEAIRKEAVDVKEARQIRKTYIDSFNQLNKAFLAGKLDPNQRAAAINALGAKMATLTSHRYNANEAAAQAEGMFPSSNDWGGKSGKTRQIKYQNGLKAIDALESGTPMMDFYGVKSQPPYPELEPISNSKTQPDGTPVMTKSGRPAEWRGGKKHYK